MFGYGKKDTTKEQVEQFGPQWRAAVSTGDSTGARWKPLQDWQAVYEPPKPPQQQSAAQSYMANKAKQMVLNKLQSSVSLKILTIAQETTSKVLTIAEAEATAASLKASLAKDSEPLNTLAVFLNNLNGVVLSFRFERDNAMQCDYLRRIASDNVADTLQQVFETAENAGKHIEDLRVQITSLIESQKSKVKDFVETSLDKALQEAVANANAAASEKLAAAKKQLTAATGDAVSTLDKVTGADSVGELDPSTQQEIQELENNIKAQRVDIQDESVAMLSDCIKLLVLKKMDKLTIVLVYIVDKLFNSVQELYKTATEFKMTPQQLRDLVYDVIESAHKEYQQKVTMEVKRGVTVLQAIMEDSGDDGSNSS